MTENEKKLDQVNGNIRYYEGEISSCQLKIEAMTMLKLQLEAAIALDQGNAHKPTS